MAHPTNNKISTEDTLFVIQKVTRENELREAQQEGRVNFEYANSDEVKSVSSEMIKLFQPTLRELKNR